MPHGIEKCIYLIPTTQATLLSEEAADAEQVFQPLGQTRPCKGVWSSDWIYDQDA